jgi:hypothetical protein
MQVTFFLYAIFIPFLVKILTASRLIVGAQTLPTFACARSKAAARPTILSKTTAPRISALCFFMQEMSGWRRSALDLKIIRPFFINAKE